jgi:DNA-binding response OmpR family regulator
MLVPGRFSSAAIGIGDGELEVRLSDGGNWLVKVRSTDGEDWRMLCRGHIDGTIFETATADQGPITVGPLRIDPAARCVEVDGAPVRRLAAREFELVALLATDPGRVFTKKELLRGVWGKRGGAVRTLDSHASRARCKLREAGAEGYIVNCHSRGYMLCANR